MSHNNAKSTLSPALLVFLADRIISLWHLPSVIGEIKNPLRQAQVNSGLHPRANQTIALRKLAILPLLALMAANPVESSAQVQRLLGIDVSAWQGNLTQSQWNNLKSVDNRQFVFTRSSRGGTTGYYDQNDSDNSNGKNTLSQRYDDPYYIQNMIRATTAGIYAGSYHFSRPDILETTLNSGGIRNSGTDEANHFIQMAGPFMRPGYLVPIHDLEAGDGVRTDDEMAQFCVDFSDRIYAVMGIRPGLYINGNYAANILGGANVTLRNALAKPPTSVPSVVSPAYPVLWSARWANQTDPNSIDVQNTEPKTTYSAIYGPWDDYGTTHPWTFWQYASTARLPSYSTSRNIDVDVVHGGIEFLKDQLVPAVWMKDVSGEWAVLTNWNSGQTPVPPVPGSGQATPVATGPLPTPRLPGAAGSGVTSGQHDTVILERPNANITVTLSAGSFNIRKLYMREALNIAGGTLSINYVPSADSTPISAQFSGPVALSNGTLVVHTLQVDATRVFSLSGGTFTLNKLQLMPHSSTPAKMLVNGNITLNPLSNASAIITNGPGTGLAGAVDLGGGTRTLTLGNGTAESDLTVAVAISNGGLSKAGAGTLTLAAANTYSGGTTITSGRLNVNNTTGSGTGTGAVTVNGGILGGTGRISGAVTLNSQGTIAPGTGAALGTLTLAAAPSLNGTNLIRIDRNAGSPRSDALALSIGTLNYGGTLVVSNAGATLTGGEVFKPFSAGAYSGAFAAANLPALTTGLNWDLGALTVDGSIKVNRMPVASVVNFTNTPGQIMQIPVATLLAGASDADSDTLTLQSVDPASTNGLALVNNGDFISYLNNGNVADRFSYVISDGHGGTAIGSAAIVPGVVIAPTITSQPQARTNSAGTDATFLVVAEGTAPLQYQWRLNETNIEGAQASTYTRQSVQKSDAGAYSVVVSNIAGVVTSSTAGLVVSSPSEVRIELVTPVPEGFHFHVSGAPGHYAIEATTNFVHWDELTNLVTSSNLFEFTDPKTNLNFRGYRARLIE